VETIPAVTGGVIATGIFDSYRRIRACASVAPKIPVKLPVPSWRAGA
jgi:hypothetical protein